MKVRRLARRRLMATASGLALSVALVAAVDTESMAGALPTSGQYIAGKGEIGQGNQSLVVKQATTAGIIDWNSFSIGRGNSVTFENGNGATLNEVTGGNLSTIAGSLHATGSLYLINQSGVIVSGSGRIVTGGSFGASTSGPDGTQRGNIVDAGTIRSAHGAVKLSGANVNVSGKVAVMRGGQIWLTSSGTTAVSGTLDADNARGAGGTIVATGKTVDVADTATIRASGAQGGTILIGGDIHGGAIAADDFVKQTVADAGTTAVAKGATIAANGTKDSGGNVVIWSDGHTSFDGAIRATGATRGGFSEVSSHELLAFTGTADLLSPSGKTGTLLLDPENVTIESAATTGGSLSGGSPNIFTPTADNSILDVSDLEAALASANVHVTTGSTGSQAGTITVAAPFSWTSSNNLELDAAGSIVFDAAVSGTNAILYLIAGSTVSSNGSGILDLHELRVASNGAVTLNAANDIGVLGAVTTSNGNFSLTNNATLPVDAALDAGTGTVTLTTTGSNSTLGIQAAVTGATVDLVSSGAITQTGSGIITATTLTGSSNGRATMNAANQITDLGAFSTNDGEFEVTNADTLTVTGATASGTANTELTTTSGNLVIGAGLAGATIDLVSAGTITQGGEGIITATTLKGSSQGNATLDAANVFSYLETFPTNGSPLSLTDTRSLETVDALNTETADLTLTTTGSNSSLKVGRALTAGTATLQASGNIDVDAALTATTLDAIDQNIVEGQSGEVAATTLTGSSANDANFDEINQVQNLGAFTLGGRTNPNSFLELKVANSLTVTGAVTSTGGIELITSGSGSDMSIDAPISAGYFELYSAGTISQNSTGILTSTGSAGGFEGSSVGDTTLNAQNDLSRIDDCTTTNNGSFSLTNAATLTVAGNGPFTGSGNISITTTGAGNNLIMDGSPTNTATVNLTSDGEITESSNASIDTNLINVVANTGILLTSTRNDIVAIGTDTTNSGPNEIDQH